MTKTTTVDDIEIHPSDVDDLNRIFKDPVLHIYKTRKGKRDVYRLELSDRKTGIKADIDTDYEDMFNYHANKMPAFGDTWIGIKADGLDFDLNLFNLYQYGPDGKNCGLHATICTIDETGSTVTEPFVSVETHVHHRDNDGQVTDFICYDAPNYLQKLAKWDGTVAILTDWWKI